MIKSCFVFSDVKKKRDEFWSSHCHLCPFCGISFCRVFFGLVHDFLILSVVESVLCFLIDPYHWNWTKKESIFVDLYWVFHYSDPIGSIPSWWTTAISIRSISISFPSSFSFDWWLFFFGNKTQISFFVGTSNAISIYLYLFRDNRALYLWCLLGANLEVGQLHFACPLAGCYGDLHYHDSVASTDSLLVEASSVAFPVVQSYSCCAVAVEPFEVVQHSSYLVAS